MEEGFEGIQSILSGTNMVDPASRAADEPAALDRETPKHKQTQRNTKKHKETQRNTKKHKETIGWERAAPRSARVGP